MFPKKCVGCGGFGKYVCEKCEVGLWEEEQIYPGGYLDGLTCLWAYEGIARKIIKTAKYKYYFDLLGELLRDASVRVSVRSDTVVVPVPLWPKREKERGFNQADVIGRLVASRWSLVTQNLLVRVRDTGRQVGRTRRERLENMRDAFKLNDKCKMINDQILLVDDVWTTGATMQECAKVLKQAGVKKVWGLVLAR